MANNFQFYILLVLCVNSLLACDASNSGNDMKYSHVSIIVQYKSDSFPLSHDQDGIDWEPLEELLFDDPLKLGDRVIIKVIYQSITTSGANPDEVAKEVEFDIGKNSGDGLTIRRLLMNSNARMEEVGAYFSGDGGEQRLFEAIKEDFDDLPSRIQQGLDF